MALLALGDAVHNRVDVVAAAPPARSTQRVVSECREEQEVEQEGWGDDVCRIGGGEEGGGWKGNEGVSVRAVFARLTRSSCGSPVDVGRGQHGLSLGSKGEETIPATEGRGRRALESEESGGRTSFAQ